MAAISCTILPLDIFRQELGWNPFHFWQLAGDRVPVTEHCSDLLRQYSWQNTGAAGRVEIIEAISNAEAQLLRYLNFAPGSHYASDSIDLPCPVHNPGFFPLQVQLEEGRITRLATESLTLLSDTATVTYYDADGDGVSDTFSATIADSTSDPATIEIYFSSADVAFSPNAANLCQWQVRPVVVTRTNPTTLAIVGAKWLCAKPAKYEGATYAPGYDAGALDINTTTNFVTTVAVYRRDISNQNTATLTISDGFGTQSSSSVTATIVNGSAGLISIAAQNCGCLCGYGFYLGAWGNWPLFGSGASSTLMQYKRLDINYRAGEALANWQKTTTRLALAELRKKICACEDANAEVYRWQSDLARANGTLTEQYRIADVDLSNPLGTRAGQIYAWNQINRGQFVRAFNV